MFRTLANRKCDEIPRWNRDRLWNRNLLATMMKFQCGIETVCGITNKSQNVMKFQCGIETDFGNAIWLAATTNFQGGKETIMEMQMDLHLQ